MIDLLIVLLFFAMLLAIVAIADTLFCYHCPGLRQLYPYVAVLRLPIFIVGLALLSLFGCLSAFAVVAVLSIVVLEAAFSDSLIDWFHRLAGGK